MALRSYSQMFREIKKSRFLALQSAALALTTYIDWTLLPYITKMEGLYLPVFMISFFMLLGALDGFVQPLFRKIKIYNIYLFTIILDILQLGCYLILGYSEVIFTYVILTVFTIQAITFEIARVHTVDFMQDESVSLKDYLMIHSFSISAAIVTGALSAMGFDALHIPLSSILIYLALLGIIGIVLQIKLYTIFKKKTCSHTIEIKKERRDLFEKFKE